MNFLQSSIQNHDDFDFSQYNLIFFTTRKGVVSSLKSKYKKSHSYIVAKGYLDF